MEQSVSPERQVLDEDLQIIRVTLATITEDVRHYSSAAAQAMIEALKKLDRAQREFSHAGEHR